MAKNIFQAIKLSKAIGISLHKKLQENLKRSEVAKNFRFDTEKVTNSVLFKQTVTVWTVLYTLSTTQAK